MNKTFAALFLGCLSFSSARAGEGVLGMNFVITTPTVITAIGARDGGTGFTFPEKVGIFNDVTGTEVGPLAIFGPSEKGLQIGDAFYERFPAFVLAPGDYSIISLSSGSSLPGGGGLGGGDSFGNLGNDLNLPEGGRFNFGTGFDAGGSSGPRGQLQPFFLTDLVPDGGTTALLLGASLAGLGWLRRKL